MIGGDGMKYERKTRMARRREETKMSMQEIASHVVKRFNVHKGLWHQTIDTTTNPI